MRVAIAASILLQLATANSAAAWGREGHRVIAKIAAQALTADARHKLAAILATTDAGVDEALAEAATWPDEIDKTATGTERWHFIDVPITAPFSVAGLCPAHDCVIDRITEMQTRLATNATGFTLAAPPVPPRPMTSEEVAFLVHFVGDVHQPLHAATDGDRGGNCVPLKHPLTHTNGTTTTELHAVWDLDVVLAVFDALGDENAVASTLFQRANSGPAIVQGTPTDWAREANALARSDVYAKLHLPKHTAAPGQCAPGIKPVNLKASYVTARVPDVERQLMRAGIRLAAVLNSTCAATGCAPLP